MKGYDSSFNSWIDKKDLVWFYCIKMSQCLAKPYEPFEGDINVKVIFQILQQKRILKTFHMFILQVFN